MIIETIDLGLEASRYRDAFDLDRTASYEFLGFEGQSMMLSLHQNGEANPKLPGRPEITFECIISEKSRIFGLSSAGKFDNQPRTPEIWTLISLDWNGEIELPPYQFGHGHSEILAKGLYFLNLLTPAIETALQVSISAHQKLEWKLEFEKKLAG